MIVGVVNAAREATIPIAVCDARGREQPFEAVIDTGFDGALTLPNATIVALGLPWIGRGSSILADGSQQLFDIFFAEVVWDGQRRVVQVEASDVDPLVGMRLLTGYDLRIQVVVGGRVTIEELP